MATGAAVAAPERQVINLQADGSGMYTLQVGCVPTLLMTIMVDTNIVHTIVHLERVAHAVLS
jgi:thiamine pyrophosphate-dependent acetolactate synthase large subunit-like protein